jgi:hypothetical protein
LQRKQAQAILDLKKGKKRSWIEIFY